MACACLSSSTGLWTAIRRGEFEWRALLAWGGASAVLVAASLHLAVHGFGFAEWDWYEHWLRSLIFLNGSPVSTDIGMFIMAARGPLFNGASALLMLLSGSQHYWVFQIIAIALNTLICLPFALLLEAVGGLSRRTSLMVAPGVCVLLPFYFWNNTFTWTKDLTAAFLLMGIYRYLIAHRKCDAGRMAMAIVWCAAGFLTHFLSLVYAAILGLHLLYAKRRDLPIRELCRAGVLSAVMVAPWFGYMFLHFGIKGTMGANTTVGRFYASRDKGRRIVPLPLVMVGNLCTNFLPAALCRPVLTLGPPLKCTSVYVDGATVTSTSEPCPEAVTRSGIYGLLGYTGIASLLMAAVGLFGARLPNARFLVWVLAGGLLLNLLPIRWFDPLGTFSENLQAWCLVLFAVAIRGLMRFPRPAIIAVTLAMVAEYAVIDLGMIRRQVAMLPLAQYESALRGDPPINWFPPVPPSSAPFRTGSVYYQNYALKVERGALYYRDMHPDTFPVTSWVLLGTGMLALGLVLVRGKVRPMGELGPTGMSSSRQPAQELARRSLYMGQGRGGT